MASQLSTLNPNHSSDMLRKLREASAKEADTIPPGVVTVLSADMDFDIDTPPITPPTKRPEDSVGAANYHGPNSPHIGNGHGGPQ